MITELKNHPKPFGEFVEWLKTQFNGVAEDYGDGVVVCIAAKHNIYLTDRELESLLIEWLRSKEIIVYYEPVLLMFGSKTKEFKSQVLQRNATTYYCGVYKEISKAIKVGISLGFEILGKEE